MTIKPPAHSPRFRAEKGIRFKKRAVSPPKTCCMRKRGYESKRRAAMVGVEMSEKYSVAFFTYRCRACGDWHLTRSEAASHDVKQKFNVRDVLTGEEK